ncbi:porin [Enterovirga rhinocerotis]|uniref:Porin n=1 Tax=Enterovirga rhinocerotis TaxID=1339210 RepID=A0A4R7BIN9_9HYPH|nr:porin [Enterovirga rhinocerotis]TDR85184.1 porin-like protein [Enterovirga rhinocerotis]
MKLVKSLLLGSAAGICVIPGAMAADLPARAVAPVEYVQACYTAERAANRNLNGFFALPGTDTCLRVSGRARFSYQYMSSRAESNIYGAQRGLVGDDNSGFQTLAFLNFDARTKTDLGTLRTFIRVIAAYSSGGYLTSGTSQRFGQSYPALGMDTFGRANTTMYLDKAFIQYLGFTAGRAASFFDFYAHDLEHFGATSGSDVASTNLLAYTATFGGGWSATISMEDPIARRQPRFSDSLGGLTTAGPSFTNFGVATQATPYVGPGGVVRYANYDVIQRSSVPDFVAAVRYDAPWGAAQVSAAMHQLSGGRLMSTTTAPGAASTTDLFLAQGAPSKVKDEIGWAVQGGLKINLPQLAQGDVLWLQAAYSEGALSYTGQPARFAGSELMAVTYSGRFPVSTVDSFIGLDGKQKLTESWSVTGAFLHYWAPQWRSAFFGSYAEVSFGAGSRAVVASLPNSSRFGLDSSYDSRLRDYSVSVVGANLIWSPVRDLDIGLEAVYTRVDLKGGRVADLTAGTNGQLIAAGMPPKTAKSDDTWSVRMRVQRDF